MLPVFFLEDDEGGGISRIEVTYEVPNEPEALFLIRADFVNPPVFERCVAQVAHGQLADGERTIQTQLSLTSSAIRSAYLRFHAAATFALEFRDQSGQPLPVILDGQQGAQFDYLVEDGESKIVRTTISVSQLDQGYACVTSNYPFELTAAIPHPRLQG
jgi:hypothetical protein